MKKSEVNVFKEIYSDVNDSLKHYQYELKKNSGVYDVDDIKTDIFLCREKLAFLEDIAYKLNIELEMS